MSRESQQLRPNFRAKHHRDKGLRIQCYQHWFLVLQDAHKQCMIKTMWLTSTQTFTVLDKTRRELVTFTIRLSKSVFFRQTSHHHCYHPKKQPSWPTSNEQPWVTGKEAVYHTRLTMTTSTTECATQKACWIDKWAMTCCSRAMAWCTSCHRITSWITRSF